MGPEISKRIVVENGTPQGSVVSPLLFNIMINDIFSNVQPGIGRSLFADDSSLWKRGKNVKHIVKKLQESITQVEEWGKKWGLRFSMEKTKTMFFTRKKIDEEIKVRLYDKNVERVKSFKYLWVFFDERITWRVHIIKSRKVLNIMRCLSGMDWGANAASLKQIYVYLLRSRMEYGSIVFGSASKSVLSELDIIQAKALGICLGAVRTSPVCALQVEAGEMPLG